MKSVLKALSLGAILLVSAQAFAGRDNAEPEHGLAVLEYTSLVPIRVCPSSDPEKSASGEQAFCGEGQGSFTPSVSPEEYLKLACSGAKITSLNYSSGHVIIGFDLPPSGCKEP